MKTLRRSTANRAIGGVCSGIAEYFNLDPILIRLVFIALAFLGGSGLILYFVAWIVIPERKPGDDIQDAEIVSEEKKTNFEEKTNEQFKQMEEQIKQNVEDVKRDVNEVGQKIKHRSGWFGYILIFLGVLFLLKIFGYLHFSWHLIWSLWPVLLIFWGIAMIPIKNWLKSILLTLCLLASLYVVLNGNFHTGYQCHFHSTRQHHSITTTSGNVVKAKTSREGNEAKFEVDAGACSLVLSDTTKKLSAIWSNTVELEGKGIFGEDIFQLEYTDEYMQKESEFLMDADNFNELRIALNTRPVWDLEWNIGAADVNLDLSPYKVKNVEINSGAANIEVKLGEAYSNTRVDIETGASSITVYIPKNADCEVISEGFLLNKNLDGFSKKSRGHYQTEKFGKSKQTVIIELEGAVSGFDVVRY